MIGAHPRSDQAIAAGRAVPVDRAIPAGLAIASLALALAAGAPARGEELWRGPAGARECRLELVNELGGVRISAGDPAASAAFVYGDPALKIRESPSARGPVLAVARAGSPGDVPGGVPGDGPIEVPGEVPAEVAILVPPGCRVSVRTTQGAVSLEVGRAAFPVRVDTVTGDITAWVHPDTDASVVFATSGRITTDYTVEIEYRYHAEAWKHGRITTDAKPSIPAARAKVRLNSRGGAVRMLRPTRDHPLPSPETPHAEREQD